MSWVGAHRAKKFLRSRRIRLLRQQDIDLALHEVALIGRASDLADVFETSDAV